MIKKIAYVDRMWGDCTDNSIGGDMSFSFNDSKDSRSENIEELIESCRDYALGYDAEEEGETYQEDSGIFAIYEIYRANLELEEEDDYLWSGATSEDELIEVFVCATKKQAGWIEEAEKDRYNNVKISYREEE